MLLTVDSNTRQLLVTATKKRGNRREAAFLTAILQTLFNGTFAQKMESERESDLVLDRDISIPDPDTGIPTWRNRNRFFESRPVPQLGTGSCPNPGRDWDLEGDSEVPSGIGIVVCKARSESRTLWRKEFLVKFGCFAKKSFCFRVFFYVSDSFLEWLTHKN